MSASGSGRSLEAGGFWIVDDSGFPKQSQHSVGVARQDCGAVGQNRDRGRPTVQPRCGAKRRPLSVKALARAPSGIGVPDRALVRENEPDAVLPLCRGAVPPMPAAMSGVPAWPQQGLLIEWPHNQAAPAHGLPVVQRSFDPFIQQREALLGHVHPQYPLQADRRAPRTLALRVERLNRSHQRRPRRHRLQLRQEPVPPAASASASSCRHTPD